MEQKQKNHAVDVAEEIPETEAKDPRNEKLADDIDAILDEIDDVLEENAEKFVNSYVQKGGE